MEPLSKGNSELIDTTHDIQLYKINDCTDSFYLNFKICNPHYNLHQAIGFKLFSLMSELNKDVIESIHQEQYEETDETMKMGMIFKRFGAEFGISQKYIYSITELQKRDNHYIFHSRQIDPPNTYMVPKHCNPVQTSEGKLRISFEDNHTVHVSYDFSLSLEDHLPIMMRNLPGLLIKKIFIRLKRFLETIR